MISNLTQDRVSLGVTPTLWWNEDFPSTGTGIPFGQAVPGDGALDFVPVLQALGEAQYQGRLAVEAEQDPARANPLEYAIRARSYLREVLGW